MKAEELLVSSSGIQHLKLGSTVSFGGQELVAATAVSLPEWFQVHFGVPGYCLPPKLGFTDCQVVL